MTINSKDLIKAIRTSDESIFNRLPDKTVSISGAGFKGDHIAAIRMHGIACPDTTWENCIFNDVEFNAIDFQNAKFTSCSFHQCRFTQTILAETVFEGCVFNHTTFIETEDAEALVINNCQFQESVIKNIHFIDTNITSSTYTQGELTDIDGEGTLKSFVLRDVAINHFDTSDMTVSACTATGCKTLPTGFKSVEGRRRRV